MLLKWTRFVLLTAVAASPAVLVRANDIDAPDGAALEFFEKQVRPILSGRCYNCHSADNKAAGGLRVDDRHGLLEGGGRGPAVVPGSPDESWLLKAVKHVDPKLKMPPDEEQLSQEEITILTKWIADGAVWPTLEIPANLLKGQEEYDELKKSHWAWQPLTKPTVPQVDAEWAKTDIDRFILAKLNESQLKPVAQANKVDLLRRVTFDLTGLPPTPDEVLDYLLDESPNALENVVDRLLASQAYGERWGRHWLDVARFGESTSSSRNLPYPHAWRYRDYVIDSFNADKPFDQFVREQIAGDLLPANTPAEKRDQLIATGFLALGVKDVNQRFEVRYKMDNVDEQIDTMSRAVLGLTVSCARCHDHKFDPVPTKDYYALAGIFTSTDLYDGLRSQMGGGGMAYYVPERIIPLGDNGRPDPKVAAQVEQMKAQVAAAREQFTSFRDAVKEENAGPERQTKLQELRRAWQEKQAELIALTDPARQGPVALGVHEGKKVGDTEVRIRGEAEKLGPVVPRGYLSLLDVPGAEPINPKQSGRLELSQWLTSVENPLVSRVYVNRVWKHLFNEGLVTTVDNFGVTGDKPSHGELLDYLAGRFVSEGWSSKKLIREIVLSRSYQLSSEANAENVQRDPANRLVWRHTARRLDAEEIRDAMLATAGQLNEAPLSGSAAQAMLVRELRNDAEEAKALKQAAAESRQRSVYLPMLRGLTPHALQVFDFAEQGLVTGRRDQTTIATQSLYLLNDAFVVKQSLALADRLLADKSLSDEERLKRIYLLALGRKASPEELKRCQAYLSDYALAAAEALPKPEAVAANTVANATPAEGESAPQGAPESKPAPNTEGQKPKEKKAKQEVVNPDQLPRGSEVIVEEVVIPPSPEAAAWTSLIQAVYGSAEFRYLK